MYLIKIIRRNSEYNPYIKWFVEGKSEETGAEFSLGFKTRKEAEKYAWKNGRIIEIKAKRGIYKNPAYK